MNQDYSFAPNDVFWFIDLIVFIGALVLCFLFFRRKNSLKVGLLALGVVVLSVAANVAFARLGGRELLVTIPF